MSSLASEKSSTSASSHKHHVSTSNPLADRYEFFAVDGRAGRRYSVPHPISPETTLHILLPLVFSLTARNSIALLLLLLLFFSSHDCICSVAVQNFLALFPNITHKNPVQQPVGHFFLLSCIVHLTLIQLYPSETNFHIYQVRRYPMYATLRPTTIALSSWKTAGSLSRVAQIIIETPSVSVIRPCAGHVFQQRAGFGPRQFSSTPPARLKEYFPPPANAPNIKLTGPAWHHPV